MKTPWIALATVALVLALAVSLFTLKVGGVIAGAEQCDRQVGYCFDAATDRAGSRLYVAAGRKGLHISALKTGHLQYISTYGVDRYLWQSRYNGSDGCPR